MLDSFRWVEGARGQAGNCGHQFWHMPPFRLDGSPSSVRAVLGRVGATAIRAGHGFSRNSPNDIWGFNPEARRPAKRFRFRFPLAAYAVPRAILLTRPPSANLPCEGDVCWLKIRAPGPAIRVPWMLLSARGGFIAERNFRQVSDRVRVNDRIRAREIRVIDEEGGQLGVMQPFEALRMARERGLDLVEISPTADPPVCKITDYGKFLYQQSKKAHEQRKSSRGSALKEVKFRPATAEHDFQVRKNQIIRFLGEGHKVRAMIFHRGREMAHQEVGRAKMTRLLGEIGDAGSVETPPRMEGNVLVALLAPKKGVGAVAARPN